MPTSATQTTDALLIRLLNWKPLVKGSSGLRPIGLPVARVMRQAGVGPAVVEAVIIDAMNDDMQPCSGRLPS